MHCTIPLIIAVKGTRVSCYCQACIQRVLHAIFVSEKIGKSFHLTFDSWYEAGCRLIPVTIHFVLMCHVDKWWQVFNDSYRTIYLRLIAYQSCNIHTFLSAQFAWQCVVGRSIVLRMVLLGMNLCRQQATSQVDWFHLGTFCHLYSWTLLWHVCLPLRVLWVRVEIGFFGFARSCSSILRFLRHFSYGSSYLGPCWKICSSQLCHKNELYSQTGSSALCYKLYKP